MMGLGGVAGSPSLQLPKRENANRRAKVLFVFTVAVGLLYILVQELKLEMKAAKSERRVEVPDLRVIPTDEARFEAASVALPRPLNPLKWRKHVATTLEVSLDSLTGRQLNAAAFQVAHSAPRVPWTTLSIQELMHNKHKGDPLRLVLPEAENQLLSIYRVAPMQYLSQNKLGGKWTLRFLAYVQELDPRPRPGPQHNTSYFSHFLDVRATIQGFGAKSSGHPSETTQKWKVSCQTKIDPGPEHAALYLECPLPTESEAFTQTMNLKDVLKVQLDTPATRAVGTNISMSLVLDPDLDVRYHHAACMGPIFDNGAPPDQRKWAEYVEYHNRVIGVEHFFIYGRTSVSQDAFQHYIDRGLVTFIAWHSFIDEKFTSNDYHGGFDQVIINNDCLLLNKYSTKWLSFFDLDEYLIIPPLPGIADGIPTVRHILDNLYADQASLQLHVIMMSQQGDTTLGNSSLMIERWKWRDEKRHSTKSLVQAKYVQWHAIHACGAYEERVPNMAPFQWLPWLPLTHGFVGHYRNGNARLKMHIVESPETHVARFAEQIRPHVLETALTS